MAKAKVSRKKLLKEPDEFLTFSNRAVRWGKENLRLLILVGSAAVLVLAAILGIQAYISYRNTHASEALAQYFPAYQAVLTGQADDKQAQEAQEGLELVAKTYGATPAGQQARLALGNLLLQKGDFAQAETVLAPLSEEPDLAAPLLPLALQGLGQALEGAKKFNEAAEAYANAAKAAGPSLGLGLQLDRARALEAAGDKSGATEVYQGLAREVKDKSVAQAARQRLALLGVAPDQAPPTPPEVPTARPAAKPGK